ncbi:MAG: hypothetical protein JNJ46_13600 [Myxococcales bacterium]|nr:hypothetical protein [Myxococcales bacterium]
MDDVEIELGPDAYKARMLPILASMVPKYGCLAVTGEQGRILTKGTVVFVKSDSAHFLLTAKHVVDGLLALSERLEIIRAGHPSMPSFPRQTLYISRADLFWSSEQLDLAVLRAPESLCQDPNTKWFDLRHGKRLIQHIRDRWEKTKSPYQMLAIGHPNFGHLGGQLTTGQWAEILSATALPAVIVLLKPRPDGSTYMMLEMVEADPIQSENTGPLAQKVFETVKENPPSKSIDLGGISGGPLVTITISGNAEIVGIVTEGSVMEAEGSGVKLLRATPIDEVAV